MPWRIFFYAKARKKHKNYTVADKRPRVEARSKEKKKRKKKEPTTKNT
jgi:hypothetical protein